MTFLVHFRLYLFNAFFTKIPFNFLRMFFVRRYITVGKNSFVSMNVKLLNLQLSKSQICIGDNCIINPGVLLDGRIDKIIIGNNVDISRDVYIYTAQHDPHSDNHEVKTGNVIIEDHVWVASRVTILPNVTLGRGCVIACGAIVTKDVKSLAIAGGIPAKQIGDRKSNLSYTINYQPPFYT
ncbi:Hexapeptide repeat of succinyl-transferase [Pedobacter suwonensis]|uniref:Hexapeptide repeat of succinyl-transferase n=2 Tax=Pedobacter suwonensis TaxID=332999 RepID=A0A1I0SRY1_9SPHI|nr:Hexapeptide repeat of succinyl-transferase [Pedobacter suwonensis]